ncbi:RNA polymerase sigma-70 factor [Fulvivirga kasyanovii]|uniref:RNA polymerase sigma-70 factor n=1 Tax=Fulvivirga kasyanovii TaxID=396812 RepID=UPI0012BBB2A4|nr:RNA polymerase sigma-70 factor [Fulvivirga kasyanovii]
MTDSKHIATQIRSGDEQAFEVLFKRHYAGMCGYAFRYVEDNAQAEEVVQDVFLNFWEKRLTLEITGSIEAYLYRSVRNACLNHIKHTKVKLRYAESQVMSLSETDNQVSDKVVELELREKIDICVDQLPPERKRIFKLSREEGLKYKEIAGQLGLSVKTVEAQMGKALKFLRENLMEYLPVLAILVQVSILVKEWLIKYF